MIGRIFIGACIAVSVGLNVGLWLLIADMPDSGQSTVTSGVDGIVIGK